MNSSNLINPFLPTYQKTYRRWCLLSGFLCMTLICFLGILSWIDWEHSGTLQKTILFLQKNGDGDLVQQYEILKKKQNDLQEKLKKIKCWQKPVQYRDYFQTIAAIIPATVCCITIECEHMSVCLKGHTQTLEALLGFVHALDQTTLFQSMNLVELQPSCVLYKQKNLVNFTVKGKLKGITEKNIIE